MAGHGTGALAAPIRLAAGLDTSSTDGCRDPGLTQGSCKVVNVPLGLLVSRSVRLR
jgi:hypothetical protein